MREPLYDFLPPDEEANRVGYYVPSPEAIEREVKKLRENRLRIKQFGSMKHGCSGEVEPNPEAHAPPVRRRPL